MKPRSEIKSELEGKSNRAFAFACVGIMQANPDSFSEDDISALQDPDRCKGIYDYRLPVLNAVASESLANDDEVRINKRQRYYRDVFELRGERFVITNNWFGRDCINRENRGPFLDWILSRTASPSA